MEVTGQAAIAVTGLVLGCEGLPGLLASALADGGVAPDDGRRMQVFAAAPEAGSEPTAGLRAIVNAAAALREGKCELAIAVHSPGPDASDGAAVLLERGGGRSRRAYAHVLACVARARAGTGADGPAKALLEACGSSSVEPRSLTLVDLYGGSQADVGRRLEALGSVLGGQADAMPHCTASPLFPPASALAPMQGFCAVAQALWQRVLPPLTGEPPSGLSHPFCAHPAPRAWIERFPRRAAVFGVGPDEDLVILLEQPAADRDRAPARLDTEWPVELILLEAETRARLIAKLRQMAKTVAAAPETSLRELGRRPGRSSGAGCRAAIAAGSGADLAAKLGRLADHLSGSDAGFIRTPDGVSYCDREHQPGRTAFLMPGQGSQYVGMLGDVCLHVPELQAWFERQDSVYDQRERCRPIHVVAPAQFGLTDAHRRLRHKWLFAIKGGEMALFAATLGLCDLLMKAGAKPDVMLGCSHGEIAALIASGTWWFANVDRIFDTFNRILRTDLFERAGVDVPCGRVAAITRVRRELLRNAMTEFAGRVFIALDNCPDQVVLFGDTAAMDAVARQQEAAGAIVMPQPFDRGYHTPSYEPRLPILRSMYSEFEFGPGEVPLYSCTSTGPFPDSPEEIRELAVLQWARTVRFGDTVERLYRDGVRCFIEIGPNSRLTSFVHSTLRGRPHIAVASNVQGQPGFQQLMQLLGLLYVMGQDIDVNPLRPDARPAPEFERQEIRPAAELIPTGTSARQTEWADGQTAQQILTAHFVLMQDFIESQRRSHAQLFGYSAIPALPAADPPRNGCPAARELGASLLRRGADCCWPMLGTPTRTAAGHFSAGRTFTVAGDPFLLHHRFGRRAADPIETAHGLPLMPFSFEMEIAAEAALRLSGWTTPELTLRDLRANRSLALDDQDLALRIESRLVESSSPEVHTRVFDASDPGEDRQEPAFEGFAAPGANLDGERIPRPHEAPARFSAEQLYARLCHGPLLQVIRRAMGDGENSMSAEAEQPPSGGLFENERNAALRIPAALLDGASQLIAWWLIERGFERSRPIPVQMRRYTQRALPASGARITMNGRARISGEIITADFDFLDDRDAVFARVDGLKLKLCTFPEPYFHYLFEGTPSSRLSVEDDGGSTRRISLRTEPFLAEGRGIWLRVLGQVALSPGERREWRNAPPQEKLRWLLVRLLAKEVALDVLERRGARARPGDLEASIDGGRVTLRGQPLRATGAVIGVRVESDGRQAVASLESHAAAREPAATAAQEGSSL